MDIPMYKNNKYLIKSRLYILGIPELIYLCI